MGEYWLLMLKVFQRPEKWRVFFKQCAFEAQKLTLDSIPLISVISIFIGAVAVIQTVNNLDNPFIPKMYVGYMAREILVLEFCSTMVALILAGKIGSNIASEIGSMRITEQIDAMEIMGVNSANYLILPKVLGLVLFMPVLVTFCVALGLLGGAGVAQFTDLITMSDYIYGIQYAFIPFYFTQGVIKSLFFGFIISSVSSFYGYYAYGGALAVGRASTHAVVNSSVIMLLADVVLTKIMLT
mgnify:CR=1 FL=1